MEKLLPILRVVPALLFVYAIVLTIASVAELRASASAAGMNGSLMTELRITYLAGFVRSFYDLFYLWGMALISMAALKYLEGSN